jgi:hypothetical protein
VTFQSPRFLTRTKLRKRRFCGVRVLMISFAKPTDDWLGEEKGGTLGHKAKNVANTTQYTVLRTSEVVLFRTTILENVAHNFVAFAYDSGFLRFTFGICLEQIHEAYRFFENSSICYEAYRSGEERLQ